jgi:hypothetical protein
MLSLIFIATLINFNLSRNLFKPWFFTTGSPTTKDTSFGAPEILHGSDLERRNDRASSSRERHRDDAGLHNDVAHVSGTISVQPSRTAAGWDSPYSWVLSLSFLLQTLLFNLVSLVSLLRDYGSIILILRYMNRISGNDDGKTQQTIDFVGISNK